MAISRWINWYVGALLVVVSSATARGGDKLPTGIQHEAPKTGRSVKTEAGYMVPYELTIPGTAVTIWMEPIPGGEFRLGSPEAEGRRNADEGPQRRIVVPPFWMARTETTWGQYKAYMAMCDVFIALQKSGAITEPSPDDVDAVTAPSNLYDPSFTYGNGEDAQLPAVTMTQFAARQYTKWLSGMTGEVYRLPSEAEWEYACRCGTETAYSFGNDISELDKFAWHAGNSNETTHPVAQKEANAWGLFDMHGNVAEWTLDQYLPGRYAELMEQSVTKAGDAVAWPSKLFPRSLRGGSAYRPAEQCRSASRRGSEENAWKVTDPNVPKSPWWYTEEPALGVGFRIVQPLELPAKELLAKYWDADVKSTRDHVQIRVGNGRGARAVVSPELPKLLPGGGGPTAGSKERNGAD